MNNGQDITKQTYEDPKVVSKFAKKHSLDPIHKKLIEKFATKIEGKRLLDLGCGPGLDAQLFAELGFEVTGLDYSKQMIEQANELTQDSKNIEFIVGDMTKLETYCKPNTFDAIWASASLLHIPRKDVGKVLQGISNILVQNGRVFISLKGGSGTQVVKEEGYLDGVIVEREYTFWEKEDFAQLAKKYNLSLDDFKSRKGRMILGKPTQWFMFFFIAER